MAKTPIAEWAKKNAHIKNGTVREALAELFSTLVLCFMVVGSGFFGALKGDSHAVPVLGTIFGLMLCIVIFGGISGAHMNPAVSIGLAVAGELSWLKVPVYIVCQILGGWLGSLLAFSLHADYIKHYFFNQGLSCLEGVTKSSEVDIQLCDAETKFSILSSFSPGPTIQTYIGIGLFTEIILTAILLAAVMACVEQGNNMKIPQWYLPFMLCLTVGALGMAHSIVTGTMLNPARDMAPRLAAWTLGWNTTDIFQNVNYDNNRQEWWLVGMFGPIIGGVFGVLFYCFMVGAQLNRDETESSGSKPAQGGDEWRNTVFIPRTVPQTMDNGPVPVQTNQGYQGYTNPNMGGSVPVKVMSANNNGQYNQGYNGGGGDNMRQRQGYY